MWQDEKVGLYKYFFTDANKQKFYTQPLATLVADWSSGNATTDDICGD